MTDSCLLLPPFQRYSEDKMDKTLCQGQKQSSFIGKSERISVKPQLVVAYYETVERPY